VLGVASAVSRLPRAVREGMGTVIALAGAVLPLDRRTRAMTDLAPLVGRRLPAVAAEHAGTPALFSYAAALLATRSLERTPIEVLTGAKNFSDNDKHRAEWHAMHSELAALSTRGSHLLVDAGHDIPFAAPEAITAAIERVATAVP
jgi:hypothetical protein